MGLAEYVSMMGTCDRLQVGAVLVRGKRVLTMGFNGAPPGHPHCAQAGHLMIKGSCLRTRHGEFNAIAQAIEYKIDMRGSTLYCTDSPCEDCARALIREGIIRVVFRRKYRKEDALDLLREARIEIIHLEEEPSDGNAVSDEHSRP
jgi:dCMP deaminase